MVFRRRPVRACFGLPFHCVILVGPPPKPPFSISSSIFIYSSPGHVEASDQWHEPTTHGAGAALDANGVLAVAAVVYLNKCRRENDPPPRPWLASHRAAVPEGVHAHRSGGQ